MRDPASHHRAIASERRSRRLRLACLTLASCAILVAPGCDDAAGGASDDPVATFVTALAGTDSLAIDVPGEEDVELAELPLEVIDAPLIGGPSGMRTLTSAVRRYLKQLVANANDGLDRILATRPTRRTADGAIWRVRFPERDQERALVMKRIDAHFDFTLWLRSSGADRAPGPWRFLVAGSITPGRDDDVRGALWIDLDNDNLPRSHGKVALLWSQIGEVRRIDVTLYDGTPDESEIGRLTRNYTYIDGPEGGRLAFDAGEVDVHAAPDHPARERLRVFTRWNATRALRADYSATGPEVRADGFRALIGSECWQIPERTVSFEARIALPLSGRPGVLLFARGDRSTCAFGVEEPPIVAPPGRPPTTPLRPSELDE